MTSSNVAAWTDPIALLTDPSSIRARDFDALLHDQAYLHQAHAFRLTANTLIAAPANEVQTVRSHAGTATGGTFRLGYPASGTVYTPPLLYNVTAAELQAALRAIPGLGIPPGYGSYVVSVANGPLNTYFQITFDATLLHGVDPDQLVKDDSHLTGDTIDVATFTPSGNFLFVTDFGISEGIIRSGGIVGPTSIGDLPGIWSLHAQVMFFNTSEILLAWLERKDGTVIASAQGENVYPASYAWADIDYVGPFAAGESVSLFTAAASINGGPVATFFEGYFKGAAI